MGGEAVDFKENADCVNNTLVCKNGKPITITKPKQLISIGEWKNPKDNDDKT